MTGNATTGAPPAMCQALVRPHRQGWLPTVDPARCTGCGWCVGACDLHLLSLDVVQWRKTSTLHGADQCIGCSDCAVACPFRAITMHRRPNPEAPGVDSADSQR